MASLKLLLPQPFGPTTAAMPSPRNRNSVRSQKDLNPCNSTFFSFSNAFSSWSLGGLLHAKPARGKSKVAPPLQMG